MNQDMFLPWCISFSGLVLLWLFIAWKYGPQRAIGCLFIVSTLVPTWCRLSLSDTLWVDARVAATIFGLVAYCFHPRATFPLRLGPLDFCMLCLLGIHALSDGENSGWSWSIVARIYGEWCVPYLAGRLALQKEDELRFLAPWAVSVAAILAACSIFEGFTSEDPWELVFGARQEDGQSSHATRWFLSRAWGCCAHPIYFGFVQVLFLPWLLRLVHSQSTRVSGILLTLLSLAGIVSTGSRAALLMALATLVIGAWAYLPRIRIPVAAVFLVLAVFGFMQRDQLLELIAKSGENLKESNKIVVDGEVKQTSGTLTRIHLLQVYRGAMIKASWLGFGTDCVTGFPVRVPVGPQEEKTLKLVPYIDNQYVLMTLRFGWLGAFVFALSLVLSSINWLVRSPHVQSVRTQATCIYFGIVLLMVAAGLMTVWMPHDIGFPLLWAMGAGSAAGFNVRPKAKSPGHEKPNRRER